MSNLSFEIKTTEDFFKMLIEDYKEFCVNRTSSRHALHCAIVAWHLTDWAYKEFIKPTTQFKGKQDKKNHWKYFLKEIKDSCPELQIMNDITDGTKHFSLDRPSKIKETNLHNGAFDQSFDHSFDTSYLYIIENNTKIYFEKAIQAVILFWEKYLLSKCAHSVKL